MLTPCLVALSAYALAPVHLTPGWTDVICFAGAVGVPLVGLALSARAELRASATFVIAISAASSLLMLLWIQPGRVAALLIVDSALVCLAWALGCSVGRRVQHAAHLLPACVVAASADLASLLSPEGPSHAIASSERALSLLAVSFPVPGSPAVAPALGIGDLLFMGLVFGVAQAHRLPYVRTVVLCAFGTALAGLAAAWSGRAIPALVPIALLVLLGLPSTRRLRPTDRSAALISMAIAVAVALATVARSVLNVP